ncbi:MAG TPA: gamma-glutamyl-gamma-aminobutyrate hydrolase family protein [Candidatus Limnocylindria bacterium]|nr:gamma-glutamyl-gamma-aminobutyrate hydrolase family protein [Candidatus Limnocylindria bacterium]
MTRPRIALTVSAARTPRNLAARERYLRVLRDAGAEVVVLEPGDRIPPDLAGVCLSGGGDIAPERYGEVDSERRCENVLPERDALELALARQAMDGDLPVLGICRGFQLINVALGGGLAMDVPGHQVKGDEVIEHVLEVADGTKLARATAPGRMRVNSRHHQAVTPDRLAPSLRATVRHDGLVEAFESDAHRWVVGVQWHPERTSEVDGAAARIFGAFVAEASRSPIATP